MTQEISQIKTLAEALTNLVNFVPTTPSELDEWYEQANCLLKSPDLLMGVPHFVWHYLSDADIRMKDDSYAEMQNLRIGLVLQQLEKGQMPTDDDTNLES